MKEEVPSNSALYLDQNYEYVKKMGAYKPTFEGIPEDYYPLTPGQVVKYIIFVVSVIVGTLAIMIAFMFWCTKGGLTAYAIIWSIIFLVFVVVLMVLFFIGGRGRIKEEK